MEAQGVEADFPRQAIRTAFQYDVIEAGDVWVEMLENRNLMAHTYNEERFRNLIDRIVVTFFPALTQVLDYLEEKL